MTPATGPIRFVASDLDRTLLGPDHLVSERTAATLRRVAGLGVTIAAATGRSHWTALPRLVPVGVVRWAICSNGSTLYDLEADRVVERIYLEPDAAAAIADLVTLLPGIGLGWEHDDGIHRDDAFRRQVERRYRPAEFEEPSLDFDPSMRLTKVMVGHDDLEHDDLLEALRPLLPGDLEVSASGAAFVEITAPEVDKGSALARLTASLGITSDEVVAFGDQQNDLAMLTWAGRGYAMANAHPLVLAATPLRAPAYDVDGVAHVLDTLFPPHP